MDEKRHLLLEKERQFREFQLWPLSTRLDLRRWLGNFEEQDVELAMRVADHFCYISDPLVDALLKASLQRLANKLLLSGHTELAAVTASPKVAFVTVEGETPSATDSGNLFARKLRDRLGVPEDRILRPAQAIASLGQYEMYVFVDDFVGSGQQMLHTWRRPYTVRGVAQPVSFQLAATAKVAEFAYCSAVCSSLGNRELTRDAPALALTSSHFLAPTDSLADAGAPLWKDINFKDGIAFLEKYGRKCGYLADDGTEDDWRGFNKQALSLAFAHGTPDATLPIFRSTRGGWKPLVGDFS